MIGIKKQKPFNAQPLLDLIKANEASKDFYLGCWVSDCGTFGCLTGNHLIADRGGFPPVSPGVGRGGNLAAEYDRHFYGLTHWEWEFLFMPQERRWEPEYYGYDPILVRYRRKMMDARDPYDKEAALNRVRKLIWWKLRKQELMADDDARHIEGDWNLAAKAKEAVLA